ncbi:MAG: serine/threonine protein kinase [Myxococcales bacterium]|nr:serine/threonine protein kinase [Myxococcales bacterium]
MYPQVFGKYVLERELARGGMARVVLATLRGAGGFEKKLVVKQIRDELATDNEFVRRFVEEAKTTVSLSHPNIVPVYELGVEQGTYFLAMELVEGISVTELLKHDSSKAGRRVGLTPEEGAYIGAEVCRALDYAHRRMKVVHRDITPRNVMIDEEGQVKLIDFGIAAPALVTGHEVFGSPGHMPPEQMAGAELGPPTDIFALAVVLMEAWMGTPPFRRATPEECDEAMRGVHPRPSEADIRLLPLDEAISRAMLLDPGARQQEASELGRALRGFLQGVDTADVAHALGERVRRARREEHAPEPERGSTQRRPSQASYGEIGTKTFAAREEVRRWSDRPESGPSTRRLEDGSDAPPSTRKIDSDTPRPDPPRIVGLDAARAERLDKADKADKVETVATKPLETPVQKHARGSIAPASGKPRWPLFALGAAGLALAAVWYARTGAQTSGQTSPSATTTVSSAPSAKATASVATASATVSAAPPPSAPPSATATAVAPTAATTSTSAASAAPSATSSAAAGRVVLSLYGDPGTRVSVDGVARGSCPTRVTVDPGQHAVRVNFEPTGEPRGERVTVRAGESVTMRADFTGATPTVRIQR